MKGKTYRVVQPFTDPYTGQNYGEGQELSKHKLEESGWKADDFKAALVSNLISEELITNG